MSRVNKACGIVMFSSPFPSVRSCCITLSLYASSHAYLCHSSSSSTRVVWSISGPGQDIIFVSHILQLHHHVFSTTNNAVSRPMSCHRAQPTEETVHVLLAITRSRFIFECQQEIWRRDVPCVVRISLRPSRKRYQPRLSDHEAMHPTCRARSVCAEPRASEQKEAPVP